MAPTTNPRIPTTASVARRRAGVERRGRARLAAARRLAAAALPGVLRALPLAQARAPCTPRTPLHPPPLHPIHAQYVGRRHSPRRVRVCMCARVRGLKGAVQRQSGGGRGARPSHPTPFATCVSASWRSSSAATRPGACAVWGLAGLRLGAAPRPARLDCEWTPHERPLRSLMLLRQGPLTGVAGPRAAGRSSAMQQLRAMMGGAAAMRTAAGAARAVARGSVRLPQACEPQNQGFTTNLFWTSRISPLSCFGQPQFHRDPLKGSSFSHHIIFHFICHLSFHLIISCFYLVQPSPVGPLPQFAVASLTGLTRRLAALTAATLTVGACAAGLRVGPSVGRWGGRARGGRLCPACCAAQAEPRADGV
jgi:hypothetical protein